MSQRKLLIVAVSVGLLTALLIYAYVRAAVDVKEPVVQEKTLQVVTARDNIPAKTTLSAVHLKLVEVPMSAIHSDAMRSFDAAVGRVTKDSLLAGEQLLEGRLYGPEERPGLTFVIPPGKRAVTVAVNEVKGVAGFVKPGDRVDVLGTFDSEALGDSVTATVLQDVEVLAIAQRMEDDEAQARVSTTVTLALTLDEAAKATLAEERGSLRLVLRPVDMKGQEWVESVTSKDLAENGSQTLQKLANVPSKATPKPAKATTTRPAPAPPQEEPWQVEVFRGVQREVVQVK